LTVVPVQIAASSSKAIECLLMARCAHCQNEYSKWTSSRQDGLCNECGREFDEQSANAQCRATEGQLAQLLSVLCGGRKPLAYGIGQVKSLGRVAANAAQLWAARIVGGVLGDISHVDQYPFALVAIADDDHVYVAQLGETDNITPEAIRKASVVTDTILSGPGARTVLSHSENQLTLGNFDGGGQGVLTFPFCCIPHNIYLPTLVARIAAGLGRSSNGTSADFLLERPVEAPCNWCDKPIVGMPIALDTWIEFSQLHNRLADAQSTLTVQIRKLTFKDIAGFICPSCHAMAHSACNESGIVRGVWSGFAKSVCAKCHVGIPRPIIVVPPRVATHFGIVPRSRGAA
jgi:hypothetical protein